MWGWLRMRRAGKGAVEQLRDAESRFQQAHLEAANLDQQAEELRNLDAEELNERMSRAFGRWRPV